MSDSEERIEHIRNGINVHYDEQGNVTHLSGEGIECSPVIFISCDADAIKVNKFEEND